MNNEHQEKSTNEFEDLAQQAELGIISEFWGFLKHSKKWWLTPIIVVLLLAGLLVILGGTAAAPFIYPFF